MHEQPSPWLFFIINQVMFVRIQTHVFEMLEVIFFVADPMIHKPFLPTNDLICAAVEGGATVLTRRMEYALFYAADDRFDHFFILRLDQCMPMIKHDYQSAKTVSVSFPNTMTCIHQNAACFFRLEIGIPLMRDDRYEIPRICRVPTRREMFVHEFSKRRRGRRRYQEGEQIYRGGFGLNVPGKGYKLVLPVNIIL